RPQSSKNSWVCCFAAFCLLLSVLLNPQSEIRIPQLKVAANTQRVGDAVDVIEPGGYERDLQDSFIIEADRAQAFVIYGRDARGVLCQLHDVIEHHAVLLRERCARVVVLKLTDEILVQRDSTQKLCVGFDSI